MMALFPMLSSTPSMCALTQRVAADALLSDKAQGAPCDKANLLGRTSVQEHGIGCK